MTISLYDTYRTITHPLSIALSEAQTRGVLIDIDAREELIKKMRNKIDLTLKRIQELTGTNINPNSPKQVKELLYDKLKFPKIYNKEGRVTTNEEAILTLHKKYPTEEILSCIISYRKDTKLIGTFLDVPLENNCIMTSYNPSGTKNYRISSSKNLWGGGMNLQNIPIGKRAGIENIRHIFIARPGFMFVKCDLRQAEAMVVARILCRYKDYNLWNRYLQPNFDIHKWAAAPIFNVPEDKVEKHQRDVGKISNHAGNYCSGPRVIMSTALKWGIDGIDYNVAKRIVDTRRSSMPGLVKWWHDVEKQLSKTRQLKTCMGRIRTFFGRLSDNTTIRDAVAFEPQSTVGDVCNVIFAKMYERTKRPTLPVLQVHDEVVVETREDEVDSVVELLKQVSQIPLHLNKDMDPLIIPIDIGVGKNWRDMEDVA